MEPFKELVNGEVVENLSNNLKSLHSSFDEQSFKSFILEKLPELELKQRISLVVQALHQNLSGDYAEDIHILDKLAERVYGNKPDITALCLPEYVSTFGLEHFDFSMEALERYTVYCSSEFAVRDFIILDQERAFEFINKWKFSKNHHVRRLASEGSRPRLPWGKKLHSLVKDPEPLRQILEHLNQDDSEYVRKSVANCLNDISKDNPEWMLDLVESWDNSNALTAWIIKHGARGLIKQGYPRVFSLFGFTADPKLELGEIALSAEKIKIGDELEFYFMVNNLEEKEVKLAVDFKVYYIKKTGKSLPKVFKLKELVIPKGTSEKIRKKHSFKDVSIRKHYPGIHKIEVVVNGKAVAEKEFQLF